MIIHRGIARSIDSRVNASLIPAPIATAAAVRGAMPMHVPTRYASRGTFTADSSRFISAKGELGGSRSSDTVPIDLSRSPSSFEPTNASRTAFHLGLREINRSTRSPLVLAPIS